MSKSRKQRSLNVCKDSLIEMLDELEFYEFADMLASDESSVSLAEIANAVIQGAAAGNFSLSEAKCLIDALVVYQKQIL